MYSYTDEAFIHSASCLSVCPLQEPLKSQLDGFLRSRQPATFLAELPRRLLLVNPQEVKAAGTPYNTPLINALVMYIGAQV